MILDRRRGRIAKRLPIEDVGTLKMPMQLTGFHTLSGAPRLATIRFGYYKKEIR